MVSHLVCASLRTPTFFDWNLGVVTGSVGSGFMVCGPLPFPRGSCQSVGFLLYLGASGAQLRKEKEVVQQKGWALYGFLPRRLPWFVCTYGQGGAWMLYLNNMTIGQFAR